MNNTIIPKFTKEENLIKWSNFFWWSSMDKDTMKFMSSTLSRIYWPKEERVKIINNILTNPSHWSGDFSTEVANELRTTLESSFCDIDFLEDYALKLIKLPLLRFHKIELLWWVHNLNSILLASNKPEVINSIYDATFKAYNLKQEIAFNPHSGDYFNSLIQGTYWLSKIKENPEKMWKNPFPYIKEFEEEYFIAHRDRNEWKLNRIQHLWAKQINALVSCLNNYERKFSDLDEMKHIFQLIKWVMYKGWRLAEGLPQLSNNEYKKYSVPKILIHDEW